MGEAKRRHESGGPAPKGGNFVQWTVLLPAELAHAFDAEVDRAGVSRADALTALVARSVADSVAQREAAARKDRLVLTPEEVAVEANA